MKFRVLVHTPTGIVQHVIRADTEDAARYRAAMAHPKAEAIQVFDMEIAE